jgi:S1-C subfamily serine protease
MRTVFALLVLAALATPAAAQPAPARPSAGSPPVVDQRPPPRSPSVRVDPRAVLQAMEEAFSAIADRVTPAVVNVSTVSRRPSSGTTEDPQRFREYFGEEFFERYFKRRPWTSRGRAGPPSSWIRLDTS